MNEELNEGRVQKKRGERKKKSRKEKKCRLLLLSLVFSLSLSLSLSLSYYKNTVVIRCLSRSLAVVLYFVVSKMYVRNESNIRSYVALSFLYTLSGAEMIKAKSLPVLSTVALTP